jgi:CheY-like chemotaxis protein
MVTPSYSKVDALEGVHILFVDDSEDERELFQLRFGRLGAEIVAVGSAVEAVDALSREDLDVVVCDLVLPDVDGCDLVRALRAEPDGVAATIPIIAATGLSSPVDEERALEAGFSGFVVKPYRTEDIVAMIAHAYRQIETVRRVRARCARQRAALVDVRARLDEQRARLAMPLPPSWKTGRD